MVLAAFLAGRLGAPDGGEIIIARRKNRPRITPFPNRALLTRYA